LCPPTASSLRLQKPVDRRDGDQIWSLAFSTDGQRLIGGSRDCGVFLGT
jgi:hypothetical protein